MESLMLLIVLLLVFFVVRFFRPLVYRIFNRRHGERRIYDNRFVGMEYANRRIYKRRHQ